MPTSLTPVLPPVICLAGPTAAGKSASTLALAERWPLEIVNVDSATIYRGMDIGTAKPSPEEQARVPQHLLDILDPAQSYSAAEFRADALRLIGEIRARGRIPLLAGGTMMYYKALRDGLDDLPQADPALRAELEAGGGGGGGGGGAAPRCTPSWRSWTPSRPRAWRPTTASASSARWKSASFPANRCRPCCNAPSASRTMTPTAT